MNWYLLFTQLSFVIFGLSFIWDILKLGLDMNSSEHKENPPSFWELPVPRKKFFLYILGSLGSVVIAYLVKSPEELSIYDLLLPGMLGLMAFWTIIQNSRRYQVSEPMRKLIAYPALIFMFIVLFLVLPAILNVLDILSGRV